jgi:hypothetical protein
MRNSVLFLFHGISYIASGMCKGALDGGKLMTVPPASGQPD